jgi:hypothetical protein
MPEFLAACSLETQIQTAGKTCRSIGLRDSKPTARSCSCCGIPGGALKTEIPNVDLKSETLGDDPACDLQTYTSKQCRCIKSNGKLHRLDVRSRQRHCKRSRKHPAAALSDQRRRPRGRRASFTSITKPGGSIRCQPLSSTKILASFRRLERPRHTSALHNRTHESPEGVRNFSRQMSARVRCFTGGKVSEATPSITIAPPKCRMSFNCICKGTPR